MKRIRKKHPGTGVFIQITSQVSKQWKPYYRGIGLGTIHEVIETPSYGNTAFGKVWIAGDRGHPVVIYVHEYKKYKMPVTRMRKTPAKIVRVRKNKIKIKRIRKNGKSS